MADTKADSSGFEVDPKHIKKCFVISPIGMPSTDVREHADVVFKHVICGAFHELDKRKAERLNDVNYNVSLADAVGNNAADFKYYKVRRGDKISETGRITEQMFDWILTESDIIIAVLTFGNPNVFYEVAVADCAARPVVLLNESSHPLPFDVKDMRVIQYEYKPRPLLDRYYEPSIVEAVEEALRRGKDQKVPFRPELSPLGHYGQNFRIYDRYIDSRSAGGRDFVDVLRDADEFFWGCGIGLDSWNKTVDFSDLLKLKAPIAAAPEENADPEEETELGANETDADAAPGEAQSGINIRIMIMDRENKALLKMVRGERAKDYKSVQDEVDRSAEFWHDQAQSHNVDFCKVKMGMIYQQISMNEHEVLYTPYAYSVGTNESPTIQADNKSALYRSLKREFKALWDDNFNGNAASEEG